MSDFDQRFRNILRRHIGTLAWWSIFNLLVTIVALIWFDGVIYYFFMMNAVWAAINFSISAFAYDHVAFRKFKVGSAFERFEVQRHVEGLMLLNIGLDIAYVFCGLLVREHSLINGVQWPEMWLGFGWSVVIQGLFLLVQDLIVFRMHNRNLKLARPLLVSVLKDEYDNE